MRFNPFHNLPLKVGAILLALLLWVHVATNKVFEQQISVPLTIVDIPFGMTLTNEIPREATLRVRATGKQLIALSSQKPELRISVAESREGLNEKELTDADADAALDIVYETAGILAPRKLNLRFERSIERNLLVQPRLKVTPATGYLVVGRPKTEPEMVRLSGPASAVRAFKHLETETVELNGLTGPTEHQVRLALPDSLHLSTPDTLITVTVEVERMRERLFSNLPVRAPEDFDNVRFGYSPERVSLMIGVAASSTDSIPARLIRVSFSTPDIDADSLRVPLKLHLPPGAVRIKSSADSVLVYRK